MVSSSQRLEQQTTALVLIHREMKVVLILLSPQIELRGRLFYIYKAISYIKKVFPRCVWSYPQRSQLYLFPTPISMVRGGSQSSQGGTRGTLSGDQELVVVDLGLLSLEVGMVSAMLYLGDLR